MNAYYSDQFKRDFWFLFPQEKRKMHPLKPGSHNWRIVRHLAGGRPLTNAAAVRLFDCFSLSSRICELKRRGWNVVSDRERLSSGKFIAVYSLK